MYKRILTVVSGSPADRAAIKEAVALAKVHGAAVLFFHVLPRYVIPVAELAPMVSSGPAEFQSEVRANGERLLAAARVIADKAGVRSEGAMGSGTDDAECIAEAASKKGCGIVVVANEGQNALTRLLTGSVIPGLITRCTVPLLVCRKASRSHVPSRKTVAPRRGRAVVAR